MNTWKTNSGEILEYKDMTTDHIENCIEELEERIESHNKNIINNQKPSNKHPLGDIIIAVSRKNVTHYKKQIKNFKKELSSRK